ncbi:MAG TPA: haloacid dehalogenase type II [Stellaceae bacterium]|nr:haloacid dehalogenase type II [Stellaceae bacterium]
MEVSSIPGERPSGRAALRVCDFKVLSFDCYGTLIDWESGIAAALAPLAARSPLQRSRDEILESFARHESAQEAETPRLAYSALLARVYRRLAAEWDAAADEAEADTFGGSVGDWPAFPDSAAALAYLKGFHKLVILSNVDGTSFAASAARLGVCFDAIYTAEEIGSYKPDPRNFRHMLSALAARGHRKSEILHVAQSLFHDHMPANREGLASAWIDRRQAARGWGATMPPRAGVHWDFRFNSLAEFVEAHRRETGG